MSVRTLVKSIQDIMRQDTGVDGDAQRISQLCWMFFLKIIDDQDQELELLQSDYRSPIPPQYQWRNWAANPEGITGEELLAFINADLFPALKNLPTSSLPGDRRRVVKDVFEDAYNYMKSGQLMRQVINKINAVDFNNLSERQHFGDIYEQILNDLQSAGNAGEYYTPRAVTAFMVDRIDPQPGETLLDPACGTGGFLTCSIRHMRDRYVKKPEHEKAMQAGLRGVEKKQLPHMLCVTNMLLHGVEDAGFVRHDNTLARPYISYTQSDRVDIVLTNPPFGGREEDGIESNFPAHFRTRETADLFLALIIVEFVDLIFAVDSVPAIFAVTQDPFIVYTSNIFAILGLRALYFALAAAMHRFKYLQYSLAVILVLVGIKIFLVPLGVKIDTALSLAVTIGVLAAGIGWSLWKTRNDMPEPLPGSRKTEAAE